MTLINKYVNQRLKVNLNGRYRLLTEDVSIMELVGLTGFYMTKMENLEKLTMSGRKKKVKSGRMILQMGFVRI